MALSLGMGIGMGLKCFPCIFQPAGSSSLRIIPAKLRVVVKISSCAASEQGENGKRAVKGIMKPKQISLEMQELLGVSEIPRTQAIKHIWAYIKQHHLQDPENKKIIVCDEKLKKIFGGRDRVGFLEVSRLINPHFLK